MNDFNPSASASAEANAIKVQGNTFNLARTPGDSSVIERIARLIAPVAYERREAAARDVRVDSLIENAKKMRREFSGWSEYRAIMEAAGYRMSNGRAENVVTVLEEAQEIIDESDSDVAGLSQESMDNIIDGSKDAYDEKVRLMWARLTAGEAIQPGSFSKRAMSILSYMDCDDARSFSDLCSICVRLFTGKRSVSPRPWIFLIEDEGSKTFNNGIFDYSKTSQMESLGIIDTSLRSFTEINRDGSRSFLIGDRKLTVRNDTDSKIEFAVSPVFTKIGIELSKLCSIGTNDRLADYFAKSALEQNLNVYSSIQPMKIVNN